MSEKITESTAQGAQPSLHLFDHHATGLPVGNYELSMEQHITDIGTLQKTDFNFTIGQKTLRLANSQLHSVYPSAGSSGFYENHLPHVIFNSSTLPWESRPEGDNPAHPTPFLFLLLLDDSEMDQVAVSTEKSSDATHTVLNIPSSLLASFFGSESPLDTIDQDAFLKTLRSLVHVRHQKEEGTVESQRACILGNRLPRPNSTSEVHLVSLAHAPDGHPFELTSLMRSDSIRLYSLFSYRFETTSEPFHLKEQLFALDAAVINSVRKGVNKGEGIMHQAFVPLMHHFRTGKKRYSIYRGPLVPIDTPKTERTTGVTSSDQLIRVHAEFGLLDVSYAAAWNLGRYLALNSRTLVRALVNWKRSHAHHYKQNNIHEYLNESSFHSLVPVQQQMREIKQAPPEIPEVLKQALGHWMRLAEIPMAYLVPDQRMLPEESLRFFKVDEAWTEAFVNGVFEVGFAGLSNDRQEVWEEFLKTINEALSTERARYGFLLNGQVVKDFPAMKVHGKNMVDELIDPVRMERNGNILMAFFAEEITEVVFSIPAHSMHAEIEQSASRWFLELRPIDSGEHKEIDVLFHSKTKRIIDVPALVGSIPSAFASGSTGAAAFGFHALKKGTAIGIPFPGSKHVLPS